MNFCIILKLRERSFQKFNNYCYELQLLNNTDLVRCGIPFFLVLNSVYPLLCYVLPQRFQYMRRAIIYLSKEKRFIKFKFRLNYSLRNILHGIVGLLFLVERSSLVCWEQQCLSLQKTRTYPANICLFKVNNKNTKERCEQVNNQVTIMTFFLCLYCSRWTYFTPYFLVFL